MNLTFVYLLLKSTEIPLVCGLLESVNICTTLVPSFTLGWESETNVVPMFHRKVVILSFLTLDLFPLSLKPNVDRKDLLLLDSR